MSKTQDNKTSFDSISTDASGGNTPPDALHHALIASNADTQEPSAGSSSLNNSISNEFSQLESTENVESKSDGKGLDLRTKRNIPSCNKDDHSKKSYRKEEFISEEERLVGDQGRL